MPSLMRDINIIARCARLYRNDKLKGFGIHGTMDSIVLQVCKRPGMSQEELAHIICIDKSNVTRKLARLEALGYVKREVCEKDKRIQRVYPTEAGLVVCEKIKCILREWNAEVTGELSAEQSELVLQALEQMLIKAKAYVDSREEKDE